MNEAPEGYHWELVSEPFGYNGWVLVKDPEPLPEGYWLNRLARWIGGIRGTKEKRQVMGSQAEIVET
jgi:hypothetical protein